MNMEEKILIFGFSGKIGVGKNYISEKIFGKKLYENGYIVHILALGDYPKYELGSRFKLIKDEFIKEMDETFSELFINKSAETRSKLQIYATDYCRNGGELKIKDKFSIYNEPSIWIKSLYLEIKNILSKSYDVKKDVFIITDVRFENEANFLKSIGANIVRIISPTRNNSKLLEEAKKNYTDENEINNFITRIKNHESETNLDKYHFDYVINNEPDNTNVNNEINDIIKIILN
jgi:hypothetical protein